MNYHLWRMAATAIPLDAALFIGEKAGQVEPHTSHSLMVGIVIAMASDGINSRRQTRGTYTLTPERRRGVAVATGVTSAAATAILHPGASPGEQMTDIQAVGMDSLATGVLVGVLTYAFWRKKNHHS